MMRKTGKAKPALFFLILGLVASGILLAAADFGESSANLGQITDEFDTSNNVSVTVDMIRNSTLEAMELNKSGAAPVYLDLTTLTEVDPGADMTVTASRNTWVQMPRNVNNYLYYDFGAGNILDFYYEYTFSVSDVEAGDASNAGIMCSISVSNVLGNVVTMRANDVIMMYIFQNGATDDIFGIQMIEYSGGALQNNQAVVKGLGTYYLIFARVGTSCKLEIYSDPAHTVLTDNLTFAATGGDNYRYLQAGASFGGATDPNDHSTGYVEFYWNGSTSSGYASSGYFTTTDYLASLNGSSLVHLTNTTIPGGTGITVEYSEDNSTWVLNDWDPLFGGFESIDLRNLNYSAGFWSRFNMSGTPALTPRLYQSRLITTEGSVGPGAPGQNVSSEWITYNLTSINVTIGVHDSGDVNSTLDIDGDTFNCSEVVGAPGYRISFNWTGVDDKAGCLWVVSNVFYDGNQAHDIHIELYNFSASAWVEIGTINDGVDFTWENVTIYGLRIPNDFVNSTGAVLGRFDHVAAGNINHDMHVEYLKLLAEIPAGPTPGAGAVTVTIVESDFPWIAIAIILMCVAYLLLRLK